MWWLESCKIIGRICLFVAVGLGSQGFSTYEAYLHCSFRGKTWHPFCWEGSRTSQWCLWLPWNGKHHKGPSILITAYIYIFYKQDSWMDHHHFHQQNVFRAPPKKRIRSPGIKLTADELVIKNLCSQVSIIETVSCKGWDNDFHLLVATWLSWAARFALKKPWALRELRLLDSPFNDFDRSKWSKVCPLRLICRRHPKAPLPKWKWNVFIMQFQMWDNVRNLLRKEGSTTLRKIRKWFWALSQSLQAL